MPVGRFGGGGGTVLCNPPISVGELYPEKVICAATLFWGPMVDKITHLLLSRETVSATTPCSSAPPFKNFSRFPDMHLSA